jgi:hypothetical protein
MAHGARIIGRIEDEARRNPAFKRALGGIWQRDMQHDIWLRIQQAAGSARL